MNTQIDTRELFALDGPEYVVRGTYHMPREIRENVRGGVRPQSSVGIIILNSLAPTRAGKGDSSVAWANAFANHGYPTFRCDLPGFGDSSGDPPARLLDFINNGEYATIAADAVARIAKHFKLQSVILCGLCAGAVSAIFTAGISRECQGLIVLDPYFHLPLTHKASARSRLAKIIPAGTLRLSLKRFSNWATGARRRLGKKRFPQNSNHSLLDRWLGLVNSGMPILVFDHPPNTRRDEEFDYLAYFSQYSEPRHRVVIHSIRGADHTFANNLGKAAVRQHGLEWLDRNFGLNGNKGAESQPNEGDQLTAAGIAAPERSGARF
jgi:pimeloyl-ACP methyl ester carboxylesterase